MELSLVSQESLYRVLSTNLYASLMNFLCRVAAQLKDVAWHKKFDGS
jgi:hypothetical protein